jgi:FkbM family methyltransferase
VKLIRAILEACAWQLNHLAKRLYATPEEQRCAKWFLDQGDQTLRLNYPLLPSSIVFDLGGYAGQWAADIYCRYNAQIYIFEPVKHFSDNIQLRFKYNDKIKIFEFGLSSHDHTETLHINGERSSAFSSAQTSEQIIHLKRASDFLQENHLSQIDLMKINIEGGEYALLEHLIETNWIKNIKNIQIQFHDFVPHAEKRMKTIQDHLTKTHSLTYQYPWVWENWERKA